MELMEFMGGCMGSFPGGSFCRLFWWRSSKSRPSSSHQDESRAVQTEHNDSKQITEEPSRPSADASCCNRSPSAGRQANPRTEKLVWEPPLLLFSCRYNVSTQVTNNLKLLRSPRGTRELLQADGNRDEERMRHKDAR